MLINHWYDRAVTRARILTAVVLFLGAICPRALGDENEVKANPNAAYERCLKVLKDGKAYQFFEPGKEEAAIALGLIGDQRAVLPLCEQFAKEQDGHLRFLIARSLGWLRDPKAVPALKNALNTDDFILRDAVKLALKEITGKDEKTNDKSASGAPNPIEEFKRATERALARQSPGPVPSFLEAGKFYRFTLSGVSGQDVHGKVVEPPSGNWVKVEVRKGDKTDFKWLNVTLISVISPGESDK